MPANRPATPRTLALGMCFAGSGSRARAALVAMNGRAVAHHLSDHSATPGGSLANAIHSVIAEVEPSDQVRLVGAVLLIDPRTSSGATVPLPASREALHKELTSVMGAAQVQLTDTANCLAAWEQCGLIPRSEAPAAILAVGPLLHDWRTSDGQITMRATQVATRARAKCAPGATGLDDASPFTPLVAKGWIGPELAAELTAHWRHANRVNPAGGTPVL